MRRETLKAATLCRVLNHGKPCVFFSGGFWRVQGYPDIGMVEKNAAAYRWALTR